MKWFEKSIGKEKILYMFNGDLDVSEIYIHRVLCYDYTLSISFYVLNIPSATPKKWNEKPFNAIRVRLSFSDLKSFSVCGENVFNKRGTLKIDVNDNKVRMNIDGKGINIMCESDSYFIDEIEPELINLEESMN